MKIKDLISIADLSLDEIREIFNLAKDLKARGGHGDLPLEGKSLGLLFQKPSTRTRVSFEVGMAQLGGQTIYLAPDDIGLGQREEVKDVARTLSRYLDGIVARTFSHQVVLKLARFATVSVINGLSDLLHPCQALSDLYTVEEKRGGFKGIKLAFIGDGNNVCHSLLHGCSKVGLDLSVATPRGYEPRKEIQDQALVEASKSGARIEVTHEPSKAIADADIVYTDVWVSMGKEKEYKKRLKAFRSYQVNPDLLKRARPDYLIMHCLPAHRGEEITDDVIDSPQSIVFDQAENRLHVQKAILLLLLGKK